MTESPSLLLQRAADKLECLAEGGQRAQWWVDWNKSGGWGSVRPPMICGRGKHLLEVTSKTHVTEVEWAATVSPVVAAPLVAWLRDSAESVKEHDRTRDEGTQWSDGTVFVGDEDYCPNEKQALEFARLILEESHET